MADSIFVRYHDINDPKGLLVQKRVFNPFTIVCLILGYFLKLLTFGAIDPSEWWWRDFTKLQNRQYAIIRDLNYHAREITSLMGELKDSEKRLKTEKAVLLEDKDCSRGYSKPFLMERRLLEPIGLEIAKPPEEYKKVVSTFLFGGDKKGKGGILSRHDRGGVAGQRKVFVPDDLKGMGKSIGQAAEKIGADDVEFVSDGKKKKGKGNGADQNLYSKKKLPGESDDDHRLRRKLIKDGDFDPSKWS